MTKECKNCGEVIDDETLFCPKCGKYVEMTSAKKEYPVKWIGIAALVIILIIVAGVFLTGNSSKIDTTLSMTSNSNLGPSNEYSVVLKDASNNPLAGEFIKVEVNNNTYTLKTDSSGTAKINLTLGEGSFEIKSYFKGDDTYSESHSSDIVVK